MKSATRYWTYSLVAVLTASCLTATLSAQTSDKTTLFMPGEIEQLVAPIALYPDSLLAQVFMASTYPLEKRQRDSTVVNQ